MFLSWCLSEALEVAGWVLHTLLGASVGPRSVSFFDPLRLSSQIAVVPPRCHRGATVQAVPRDARVRSVSLAEADGLIPVDHSLTLFKRCASVDGALVSDRRGWRFRAREFHPHKQTKRIVSVRLFRQGKKSKGADGRLEVAETWGG